MDAHAFNIAATGFVHDSAGSVASANELVLAELLRRGHRVDFFAKRSFVYPQGLIGREGFRFVDVTNRRADGLRRGCEQYLGGTMGWAAGRIDAATYNRALVAAMARGRAERACDLTLWLGEAARGRAPGTASVSWLQGPPGTDARSIFNRAGEVRGLIGPARWAGWAALAAGRLSVGLPPLRHSDHLIVGSQWSRRMLIDRYDWPARRAHALPYPIDLGAFARRESPPPRSGPLRVLWLGRIVPRKRMDLLLDAAARAIGGGADVRIEIVGRVGFVSGYEKMPAAFPFPERIRHTPGIPRGQVPTLLREVDVLCQPSDEENFGSSVAEALACGTPAIVGATNGTGDYLCERSVRLTDDRPETLAAVLAEYAQRKRAGRLGDPRVSRAAAERHFAVEHVVDRLETVLKEAMVESPTPYAPAEPEPRRAGTPGAEWIEMGD